MSSVDETVGDHLRDDHLTPDFTALVLVRATGEPPSVWKEEEALLTGNASVARREAFRLGRRAAHLALGELGMDDGPILRGAEGEPLWPAGVVGSITNKPPLAAAFVADQRAALAVGVDLEILQSVREIEPIVLRPEETQWLASLSGLERDRAVLSVFAAKEALFKALYPTVKRRFGFEAAALEPRTSGLQARLVEDLHADFRQGSCFDVSVRWEGEMVLCWLVVRTQEQTVLEDTNS